MLTPEQAALEVLRRRKARQDLRSWCQLCGFEPARHHDLIISKLQALVDGTATKRKLMLLMPPGTAKSTYTSKLYVPWYLGKMPDKTILACSYSYTLAEQFGRFGRNLVQEKSNILGYELKPDSKAAGEWETTKGGRYFCAGVGAGIAGHRADCGLIDDPIGSQEDADSKLVRDKQWDWYRTDFRPRLKPNAIEILICNRRHEQDLAGMILSTEADEWDVVLIPFYAGENDCLGRSVGEPIWPEYFNKSISVMVEKLPPRLRSGLYQQRPAPEEGDFFKREWLVGYESQDLPAELRKYGASDHAISKKDDANKTCMGFGGIDSEGVLWLLPEIFWQRADSEEQCFAMMRLNRQVKPLVWRAEKGHISQSLGPFLRKMMRENHNFINILEYTPKKDKPTRARSIQGMFALGRVRVPKFAPWWPDAEHQLLTFPASAEDDFVDMIAHLGNQVEQMTQPEDTIVVEEKIDFEAPITMGWIKDSVARQRKRELALVD